MCGREREERELFRGCLGDETCLLKRTALRDDFIQVFHQYWVSDFFYFIFFIFMVINVRKESWAEFLRPMSMGADFRVIS